MLRKKYSLTTIVIIYLFIVIVPINLWFVNSANETQKIVLESTKDTIENIGQVQLVELRRRMEGINNYFVELSEYDGGVYNLSMISDETDFTVRLASFANECRSRMGLYNDADFITLYSPKFDKGFLKQRVVSSDNLADIRIQIGENFNKAGMLNTWYIYESNDTKWLIHASSYNGIYYAAGINLTEFCTEIRNDINYKNIAVSMDKARISSKDSDAFDISIYVPERQLYLNIICSRSEILAALPIIQRYSLAFSFIGFVSIPILVFLLRRIFIKPMKIMINAMRDLKEDRNKRIISRGSTKEFDEAYSSFNRMADELMELKIENYEQRLGRQRLEIENLQLSMNPHFLMNTFNLIFNLAQLKEYKNIQKMVLYLSDYFRYLNTKKFAETTVLEEMKLIGEYLEVASIQYINNFEWDIDIDDDLSDFGIPPLLLHNFVENFFKYGVTFDRKCRLDITGTKKEGYAVFKVMDDGRGMNPEFAKRMTDGIFEFEDGKTHLGIRNNYLRLRYLYDERATIKITSELDQGTKVEINIPFK